MNKVKIENTGVLSWSGRICRREISFMFQSNELRSWIFFPEIQHTWYFDSQQILPIPIQRDCSTSPESHVSNCSFSCGTISLHLDHPLSPAPFPSPVKQLENMSYNFCIPHTFPRFTIYFTSPHNVPTHSIHSYHISSSVIQLSFITVLACFLLNCPLPHSCPALPP